MPLGIIAVFLITAPPNGERTHAEQTAERTVRVKVLYELGSQRSDSAARELMQVARTGRAVWERQAALQALSAHHKHLAEPVVRALMKDPELAIQTEATVRHYQWTQSPNTLKALEALRKYGSSLRRAFQTGEKAGRPTYGKGAAAFLRQSLHHSLVYTRLDGALGLVELGTRPHAQEGLLVISNALRSGDPSERLIAVKHLSVSYDEPEFRLLLETATQDSNAAVAQAAKNILFSAK